MKKELNSFYQLYILIIENPEVTIIINENYSHLEKKTIMIRHVNQSNQNDIAELETYGKKLEGDYIVRETIGDFQSTPTYHRISCMYMRKMFACLLLMMEKCSIGDTIVKVGDDKYIPLLEFIDDIRDEIYEVVSNSNIFEYHYQRLREVWKRSGETINHKRYFI